MHVFSLKKLRLINYLLAVFTLAAALLLSRDIISISLAKKERQSVKRDDRISVQPVVNKKNLMQYASILEKNPFGAPKKLFPITESGDGDGGTGDISLSNLILTGTAVGTKGLSYAIFYDNSQAPGQQELFAVGDKVFHYGILKKIGRSSVELERNSATYTITIPDAPLEPGDAQYQSKETAPSQASFARKIGEREYILDSQKIQKSLENPEQILTDARLLPVIKNGKQEGFAISEVVPDGIYHSLGLRNGDVLLRINDLEISNPEVAIQAMSALRGMNNINLDIIRNGQNMSMNYQIK
jgi:general secretion pathway protein C